MPLPNEDSMPHISHRAVLRGAGVAVALPWLESLTAVAAPSSSPAVFPKRFGVIFMGNGINENHWSATGSGAEMKLSKTLSPLEPIKHKINVIDGLFNKEATGLGIHPPQTGGLLSGAHLEKGATIHSGVSVDQMIANAAGAGWRPGRYARDRAHAQLSQCRRREPQDVQLVPVDHGSHGNQARSLW